MSGLLELRNAIANGLATDPRLVADKVSVQVHGGDFDETELKKFKTVAPAVIVSLLDVINTQMSGGSYATCTFAIACVTSDRPGVDKASGAVKLANQVLLALNRKPFWDAMNLELKRPSNIAAKNEYSSKLNGLGCAIWSIGFQQQVTLDDSDQLVVDDLSRIGIKWDISEPHDGDSEAEDLLEDLDAEPLP